MSGTAPRHKEAGPTVTNDDEIVPSPSELAERLARQRAEWAQRRDAERADRAERAARRAAGKAIRHSRRGRR